MSKSSYSEKLRDPRWQKRRLEVMDRDGWKCSECGDDSSTLNVHHTRYRGRNPWDTPASELKTLCESCHGKVSDSAARVADIMRSQSPERAAWLLKMCEWSEMLDDGSLKLLCGRIAMGVASETHYETDENGVIGLARKNKNFDVPVNDKWFSIGAGCHGQIGTTIRRHVGSDLMSDIWEELSSRMAKLMTMDQMDACIDSIDCVAGRSVSVVDGRMIVEGYLPGDPDVDITAAVQAIKSAARSLCKDSK